jgi:hypothetical protein
MTHTCFATIVLVISAYFLGAPGAAMAAEGKCTSIQAQCALEIGGSCDPKTGHWCYGPFQGRNCDGSPHAGGAFNDCVSRKLAGRK